MCYALLPHPLLHHAFMLLLPFIVKSKLRLSNTLNQPIQPGPKGLMPQMDWDAGEYNCTSKKQILLWVYLASQGGMEMQNCPGNKPSDRRIWDFNTFSHLKWLPVVDLIVLCRWSGQERSFQEKTQQKLHTVGRFPGPHMEDVCDFPKRQRWCLRSLSCSRLGPLEMLNGSLLAGRTKWVSCPP